MSEKRVRKKKRSEIGYKTAASKRGKLQLKNETPEQRQARLLRARENQRRRFQNETLAEREERLSQNRWIQARRRQAENHKARQRRLEKVRVRVAVKRSRIREHIEKANRLMQTEDTFETIITRQIRDQLHQTQQKVLRLSASNVKHLHIVPNTLDNDSNTEALHETSLLVYSCPMEDGLNSEDASPFEPKVVLSELDYPPNIEPMIRIKTEPMASESDLEMIIGDPDISSIPEPMNSEPDIKCEPINSEPDCELITGDMPNPEPIIREMDLSAKSQIMDSESVSTEVRCETNIKSEVYTVEL